MKNVSEGGIEYDSEGVFYAKDNFLDVDDVSKLESITVSYFFGLLAEKRWALQSLLILP